MKKRIVHKIDENVKGNRRKDYTLIACLGVIPKRKGSRLIEASPLRLINVWDKKFMAPLYTEFQSIKFVGRIEEIKKEVNGRLGELLKQAQLHIVEEKTPKEVEQERIASKSW